MRVRFGWDHASWFGQFATVATGVLALALMGLGLAALVLLRYEARIASGAIDPPALRGLADGDPILVLGASVGDVPGSGNLGALTTALRREVKDLPWARVLHRQAGNLAPAESLFFPVNGIGEAFAICARLAQIPPACAPAIASTGELRHLDGRPLSEEALARLGIAPYAPPRGRTRVVDATPPRESIVRVTVQRPLALQPGFPTVRRASASPVYWLSDRYRPGDSGVVEVVAAGDVMMGSIGLGLNPGIRPHSDAANLVGAQLAGLFRRAGIAFANLEGPLYDGPLSTAKDCANCFAFHSPPFYAGVLASLGLDVVSLANNHSGDYGEAGRDSTMAALRAHGIAYAGLDRTGARAATLILPGGRKAAVVAFAPNHGTLNLNDVPAAAARVRSLKRTHDLVIVSFHGGAEGWAQVHVPKREEIFFGEDRGDVEKFAHAVVDAGADLVVGQGPHVPRAVEIYRGRLIAYSLGNFWTYSGVNNYAVSGLGPVLEAWLAPDGAIAGLAIHSTRQAGLGVPHPDPLDEAGRYILYLTNSDFPATAARLTAAGRANPGIASAAPGS